MKLAINSTEYEINDSFTLMELIDNSSENLYPEIILKLLDSDSFSNIITDNDQLIALLASINDNEISKIINFIVSNKQEFQRLIPTTHELKQTLLTINTEYAESVIEYILNDQNEFDRLIKDQDRFQILIDFLDEEFSEYTKKVFEKIISFNNDQFNNLLETDKI